VVRDERGSLVTALELARRKLAAMFVVVRESEKSAISLPVIDLNSLTSLSAQTREQQKREPIADLSSLYSLNAQYAELPERGTEQVFGLTAALLARLKRQAARGDSAAAREAAELEDCLLKCDHGEIELPPDPNEQALIEWNRLCGGWAKRPPRCAESGRNDVSPTRGS
jgi:hypothetical protein